MQNDPFQILAESAAALKRLGVRRLGVFGSFARGEARADSDIDLLAEMDGPGFDAYMDAKFLLEARLQRKVDLVLRHTLKPALRDRVLAEAVDVPGFFGEAVKHLAEEELARAPEVEWRKIAELRDILTHAYFGVDSGIIQDVVLNKLAPLKAAVERLKG